MNIYAMGQGVERDMERAMKWYEQAASAGDAHSQYIVGLACLEGSGVPVDEGKAFCWLRLAAGQDHVNAMLMLSVCYSTGKGTPQDADMAEVWKKKALQLNAEREGSPALQTQKR
ncbi:tetratricopeptide repeat protein [Akkermansia sp.]|uniref:tetratricopeptide repeat protein n=1 Tax=Akkermansia sp. TaxID=1872421 RepID=UPI002586ED0F|nr:tetratricopeptide repeat protein [Akkermansia sp.]